MNKITQLLSFLEQSPNDQFLHHALALEYIKLGEYKSAKERFYINLGINDEYVATYYHLGGLLEKMNLIDEAIEIYEKGMIIATKIGDKHAYGELRSVYEELTF